MECYTFQSCLSLYRPGEHYLAIIPAKVSRAVDINIIEQ